MLQSPHIFLDTFSGIDRWTVKFALLNARVICNDKLADLYQLLYDEIKLRVYDTILITALWLWRISSFLAVCLIRTTVLVSSDMTGRPYKAAAYVHLFQNLYVLFRFLWAPRTPSLNYVVSMCSCALVKYSLPTLTARQIIIARVNCLCDYTNAKGSCATIAGDFKFPLIYWVLLYSEPDDFLLS